MGHQLGKVLSYEDLVIDPEVQAKVLKVLKFLVMRKQCGSLGSKVIQFGQNYLGLFLKNFQEQVV